MREDMASLKLGPTLVASESLQVRALPATQSHQQHYKPVVGHAHVGLHPSLVYAFCYVYRLLLPLPRLTSHYTVMQSSRSSLPAWLRVRRLDRILFAVTACSVLLLVGAWLLLSVGSDDREPRLSIAESLLSGDDREGPLEKMDSSGHFQRYEGITVIMPVNTTLNPQVYQQAYDLIYTLFGGIVSPLPVDSYHVTLTGVATRAKCATVAEYNVLMTESRARLESVKWQLHNNAKQQHSVTFSVEDARLGARAISLTLRPSTDLDEAELRRLNALMDRSLGPLYYRQPRWHMGLAYRHQGLTIEQADFAPLQTGLMDIYRNVEVIVTPPVLCAFYDMRQFRPL